MLPEVGWERRDFDREAARMGGPLHRIQAALHMLYQMAPKPGSYGARLAIMANELEKAAEKYEPLTNPQPNGEKP